MELKPEAVLAFTSIMHSHMWGKSEVIRHWCIQEFKSSLLIQMRDWIQGREVPYCQYTPPRSCTTTLIQTSGSHIPELWPHR